MADEYATRLAPEGKVDLYDHMRAVILEMLVNAVKHRDHDLDVPIQVDAWPNGLEVTSPGAAKAARVVKRTFDGVGERNPELADLLARLGYGRQRGVGWERAKLLASACGMLLTVHEEGNAVVASLEVNAPRFAALEVESVIGVEIRVRSPNAVWRDRVLRALEDGEWHRTKDLQDALNVPRSTLTRLLRALLAEAKVERSQAARNAPNQAWRRPSRVPQRLGDDEDDPGDPTDEETRGA